MLIQLKSDHGHPPQWAMIEMQGEIERKDGLSASDYLEIGALGANDDGSIRLTIGYHQLEGTKVALKKPMAIMEKSGSEYKVIGVVRDKYLFKSRPKPLITKPEDLKK